MPCPRSEDNNPCETVRGVGVRFVGARHVHAATVGELCLFRSENRAPKTQDSTQASLLLSVSNHEAVSAKTALTGSLRLLFSALFPFTGWRLLARARRGRLGRGTLCHFF